MNEKVLFEFTDLAAWERVNDDVMGGISKSAFETNQNNTAKFSGVLSPENNGGFASYRTLVKESLPEGFAGVTLRFLGDGNQYNIRFRTHQNFDGFSYSATFKSEPGQWTETNIPFEDFVPTFRGRLLENKPQLESKDIKQIGILISDKQFGEFWIDLDWIKIYM